MAVGRLTPPPTQGPLQPQTCSSGGQDRCDVTNDRFHRAGSCDEWPLSKDSTGRNGSEAGADGNRGQGFFVARTYVAKMGGTITVCNVDDGVSFMLTLQRVRGGETT